MIEWIPHEGGSCPVDPEQRVVVKHRGGPTSDTYINSPLYEGDNRACKWFWRHNGNPGDIVAYALQTETDGD